MAERKTKAQQSKAADVPAADAGEDVVAAGGDAVSVDDVPGDTGDAPAEPAVKDEPAAASPPPVPTSGAAPLEPPEQRLQRLPHLGDPGTSSNPVAANSGLASVTGSDHRRLLTETAPGEFEPLPLEEVFTFPEAGSPSNLATVKTRVYEEFTYPNTTTRTRHLFFPAGEKVPVREALRILETYKHAEDVELPQP